LVAVVPPWNVALLSSEATARTIFDRVLYNGVEPLTAGANGGFYHADTLDLPAAYTFLSLKPVGNWSCNAILGQFAGGATVVYKLTWRMVLQTNRVTWS
jgi:hypothetical protein